MREILFRAKTPRQDEYFDDGEWVEGFYTCFNGKEHRIYGGYAETDCGDFYPDWCNVRPETVGQYTGLTDKNGKKIFEGDIVKAKDGLSNDLFEIYGYVDHKYGSFVIVGECITHFRWLDYDVEVIGNIHDNPELLKGE